MWASPRARGATIRYIMNVPGWFRLSLAAASLAAAAQPARAEVRRVAIANLAGDQQAGAALAAQLRRDLEKHPDLQPVEPGTVSRALEGTLPADGPSARAIAAARKSLDEARAELVSFRNKVALRRLAAGFAAGLGAEPSPGQAEVLADVAFLEGRVELREQNRGDAREAFELARRLDPDRQPPDPRLFNPSIVAVYREAGERIRVAAEIEMTLVATYDEADLFVDGKRVGHSPLTLPLGAGLHVVAATRSGYAVAARRIEVGEGAPRRYNLELHPLAGDERARHVRREALAAGGDPVAAARAAVDLTGAAAALVIRDGEDGLAYALCSGSGRMSRFWPAATHLDRLVALLLPVELPKTALEIPPIQPPPAPWWERPGPIAGLVGGVAVASMLGVLALTVGSEIGDRTGTCCSF